MAFYVDLKEMSIDQYKKKLTTGDLIPSRMILREDIDQNFTNIKKQKLGNVDELLNALKTKDKVQAFADQSGISHEYLTVLSRELRSFRNTAGRMKEYPDISEETLKSLVEIGVKKSNHLYNKVMTPQSRNALSEQTGIDEKEVLRLTRLTDLSRVRWVNENFARVLIEAGYNSVEKLAHADYKQVYLSVKKVNEEKKYYPAHIGEHDMKLLVDSARELSVDILY